jgi:hypothetical protein
MTVRVTAEPGVPPDLRDAAEEIMERHLGPHGLSELRMWPSEGDDGSPVLVVEVTVPPAPFSFAESPAVRAQVQAQFELFQRLRVLRPGIGTEVWLRGETPDVARPAA